VELCRTCKGMLVDAESLERLAGGRGIEASTQPGTNALVLGPCLRCNTDSWQARAIGSAPPGLYACGACWMVWLLPGQLDRLRAHWQAERWQGRGTAAAALAQDGPAAPSPPPSAPGLPGTPLPAAIEAPLPLPLPLPVTAVVEPERFDRVSFERGTANWLAAPVALVIALSFVGTSGGRFFGSLIGMPFHELGHALVSWLSSRFAVPLPFFTVWHEEQSALFGVLVAAVIAAFGVRCWLERRNFGVALALVLLALQLGMSWLVPPRFTLMLQIMGGALGEIVLGSLVLVAFHFPLPDRLRWDFWRWPALVPSSICLAHALVLWLRAVRDTRHIPWGSAMGAESDGDMNRLVNVFGWRGKELAAFFLSAALLSVAALAAAQVWAWYRSRRVSSAAPAEPHAR